VNHSEFSPGVSCLTSPQKSKIVVPMTGDHLSALLASVDAKKDDKGWTVCPEGRLLTLYAAFAGASLNVNRVEAVKVEGDLIHARTSKGEVFVIAKQDVYAGASEGPAMSSRKAGFA
jgi:hypothetical protein